MGEQRERERERERERDFNKRKLRRHNVVLWAVLSTVGRSSRVYGFESCLFPTLDMWPKRHKLSVLQFFHL
jgi:hypothetical protein